VIKNIFHQTASPPFQAHAKAMHASELSVYDACAQPGNSTASGAIGGRIAGCGLLLEGMTGVWDDRQLLQLASSAGFE